MADELDEFIEQEKVKDQPGGDPPPAPGSGEEGKETPPASPAAAVTPPAGDPPPSQATPKEILGIDGDWDGVKTKLTEAENLRRELDLERGTPRADFANDNVAAYNEFVKKTKIEDVSVYQRLLQLKPEDPIGVLTTKYIVDNPEYAGKADIVAKKLERDFGLNAENLTEDEKEINKMELDSKAKAALTDLNGLRESLKTVTAPAKVDYEAREKSWTEALTQGLSFEKLPIPIMNGTTNQPELYLEYAIPADQKQEFISGMSKVLSKTGDASPEVVKDAKARFVSDFLYKNFASISHAISTKAASDKEAELDKKYNGAGKLGDNPPPPTPQAEDAYDKVFGAL